MILPFQYVNCTFLGVAPSVLLLELHSTRVATLGTKGMGILATRSQYLHEIVDDLGITIAMVETLQAATTGDTDVLACKNCPTCWVHRL